MHFWDRMLDDGGALRRALEPLMRAAEPTLAIGLCDHPTAPFALVSVMGGADAVNEADRDKVWQQALEMRAMLMNTLPDGWLVYIMC